MSAEDHYEVLGVEPDADAADITAAFEARRREGPEVEQVEVAFRILADPHRRALYDELRRRETEPATQPEIQPADEPVDLVIEAAEVDVVEEESSSDDILTQPADGAGASAISEDALVVPSQAITRRRGGIGVWGLLLAVIAVVAGVWAWPLLTEPPAPDLPVASPPAPPAPAGTPLAANTLHSWTEETAVALYSIDGLTVAIEGRGPTDQRRPVIRVTAPGGETFEYVGQGGLTGPASAHFGVGRLDPKHATSEVLFTTFSGGAHCCTSLTLLELQDGAWRAIELGSWDGEGIAAFPKDENGDGHPEFVLTDDRFLYAFTSYAESFAPPLILQLRNGEMVDRSAEPGYQDLYVARAGDLQSNCRKAMNGACAAFAAVAARLGQIETAWPTLLASYDANSDWTLPSACRAVAKVQCPPEDEVTFATFPESLRWFLGDNGYTPPVPLPRREPAVGPAFDCTKVKSNNLRLVCTDPQLSAADREMERVYLRALALTPDIAGLRNQQNAFLAVRNNAPLDLDILLGLYQERIEQLSAGLAR